MKGQVSRVVTGFLFFSIIDLCFQSVTSFNSLYSCLLVLYSAQPVAQLRAILQLCERLLGEKDVQVRSSTHITLSCKKKIFFWCCVAQNISFVLALRKYQA